MPEGEAGLPHIREEGHSCEPVEAPDARELLLRLRRELARSLDDASEAREVKIRELQKAVKNGTYRIRDEQIADKMLRSMLLDYLA